jgi:hypothetical protein
MHIVDSRSKENKIDLFTQLRPETSLEERILLDPEVIQGMFWGVPRFGHPEGEVWKHVRDILHNIERLTLSDTEREHLRFIAFVHDTFKFKEHKGNPRDWNRHHSILARQYAEQLIDLSGVLDIIELHDEAYYIWRLHALNHQIQQSDQRFAALINRLGPHLQLYYLFFKCDTCTGDKNLAPLKWFEQEVQGIKRVELR